MLPVVVLALLCGFLAQNAQGHVHPQATMNLSPKMFQRMISARMDSQAIKSKLQNLPLQNTLKTNMKQSGGAGFPGGIPLVGGLVNNLLGNILGVKIKNVELLKLDVRFDAIEKRIFLIIPADLEVEVNLPLNMGKLLHVKLYLDIQVGVRLFNDPKDGRMRLVLGNCQNKPGHIRITLLDNKTPLMKTVNDLLRMVTNILEKTLPDILQKQLCPLINSLVKTVLDLLQGSWSSQLHGETIQLSPSIYNIHQDAMEIGYQGEMRLVGGQKYTIPPVPAPLPRVPLSTDTSMNMLLSDHFLSSVLLSALPPGTLKIDSPQEVAYFSQHVGTIPEFSMPAGAKIGILQISYGIPELTMTEGMVQVEQDMELKVFGDHHRGANVLFFTIKMKAILNADVSTDYMILRFVFRLHRLNSISLVQSSVGTFDPLHLGAAMSHILSNTFVPHANNLLSSGYPLSMMQNLGVEKVNVASGKDSLLLTAPEPVLTAQQPVLTVQQPVMKMIPGGKQWT